MPDMPTAIEMHRTVALGRMRSRAVGTVREGVPEVVVVMGSSVADYLMPAVATLANWTRAHLVELPGFAGSGEPPHNLSVAEHGHAVASWLDAMDLGAVVLGGHSSGTQVAAHAAALRPDGVNALVLASPTIDPVARSWPRLIIRWRLDGRHEPPGLTESHLPEWRRAGARRLVQLTRAHLHDELETTLANVAVPTLILRGRKDRLLTSDWVEQLVAVLGGAEVIEMEGAHTFVWLDPEAWSEPIRRFVLEAVHGPDRLGAGDA